MTRRRAATTLLVLVAALAWAPLGVSSLGGPAVAVGAIASGLPVIVPDSSPSPGAGTAAPAPVVSQAVVATPLPAPVVSQAAVVATPVPAPAATAIVVAHAVTGGAKPAASPAAAGKSASPATRRSASPAASANPQSASSPNAVSDRPAPGRLPAPGEAGTLPWLLGLGGLGLVGSLLVLFGRRHSRRAATVLAGYPGGPGLGRPSAGSTGKPHASPMVERRRSASGPQDGIERRRPVRLQPADDPILRAMGLGPDAPAAGGARAVRAKTRRIRQGLEPPSGDEPPA